MQLNELKRNTPHKAQKRVGRGGGRGKTSGRGTKGQKARAGHKMMPAIREILKKLPKRRGYRFTSIEDNVAVVNVAALEQAFAAGATVTPVAMVEAGLIRSRRGKTPTVKILGDGTLSKKFVISGCTVSASAKEKI
jgi:large subunit ribosomal protein L15